MLHCKLHCLLFYTLQHYLLINPPTAELIFVIIIMLPNLNYANSIFGQIAKYLTTNNSTYVVTCLYPRGLYQLINATFVARITRYGFWLCSPIKTIFGCVHLSKTSFVQ